MNEWLIGIYLIFGIMSGELYIRATGTQKHPTTVTGYLIGVMTGPLFLIIFGISFLVKTSQINRNKRKK